jgi:hypothetical protein
MLIHQLPLDGAFSTLRSTPAGLSPADATARRLEFGPNRIERLPEAPLPKRFAAHFAHVFAALLRVAAVWPSWPIVRRRGKEWPRWRLRSSG